LLQARKLLKLLKLGKEEGKIQNKSLKDIKSPTSTFILNNKNTKPVYTPGILHYRFRIPGVSGQALPETALSRIATQWAVWKKESYIVV
jgi:hypothetical protein